jgi:hypothetical protein
MVFEPIAKILTINTNVFPTDTMIPFIEILPLAPED